MWQVELISFSGIPNVWPAESIPCQPRGPADWCPAVAVAGPRLFGLYRTLPWEGQNACGFPLALPDGDECLATGSPQVVLVLFSGLPSLLGSSAEPCVLKLATVLPVIQTAMEMEHGGGVRVIAIHGQVSQAQSHLRSIAGMQQTCQLANIRLVGQPLEGGPAVTRSIPVRQGTIVRREVRPAPDMACADGHVLGHAPGVEAVGVEANQGMAGEGLGSVGRLSDGGVSNFRMSLEHDGRPSYDGLVQQLRKVSLIRLERVEQGLRVTHAITHAYARQRWPVLELVQFCLLAEVALLL